MRAVNLMPAETRTGGRPSRSMSSSSYASYFVLAALSALLVFAALWTAATKQINSGTDKLAKANAEAQAAEKRAEASAPYQAFAELARNRKATVSSLAATRFDWANGLREVARVVPGDVWLTGITGTSGAGDAAPGPTTSAAPAPQFEMTGCTTSQAKVAQLLARLRAVNNVRSVELKTSTKPDDTGSDDCPANKASNPTFSIVISFAVPGAAKPTLDSTGQVAAAAPAADPAAAGATPATTGAAPAAAGATPAAAPAAPAASTTPTPAKDAAR